VLHTKHRLGGQESSGGIKAFSKPAACDLIIDATADAKVFNYLVRRRRDFKVS
jgi:hypothetical protein